jgi:V-type H+-transporting ATPase subunit H
LVSASLIIGSDEHDDPNMVDVGKKIKQCLSHVSKQDASGDDYFVESIALSLKNCLKNSNMMEILVGENFAPVMCAFISNQASFQTLYYAGFALLLVALKPKFAPALVNPQLCKAMISKVTCAKEKVKRVYLQAIDCMLVETTFAEMCVMYGLFTALQRLTEENFKDEDIPALINNMLLKLKPHVRVMSSMERFSKELSTKILEWGPVHTEQFWKKNFMKFETNEFQLVKDLCALLESQNEETVKVAAFDIGEFARLYPEGRRMVTSFGGKDKLFRILSEDIDDDMRKHILLATQKLLVVSWQSIE